MARRIRTLYSWSDAPGRGVLRPTGSITVARLQAWEYEPVSGSRVELREENDVAALWRTKRPDLAPTELWVGDAEDVVTTAELRLP